MITKKLTYTQWHTINAEILGLQKNETDLPENIKTLLVGLKNEDVSQGVVIKLNRIAKQIEKEINILSEQLVLVKEDKDKLKELWNEECEISFEELDIDKLDFKRKDNSFGEKYDYTHLIETITK